MNRISPGHLFLFAGLLLCSDLRGESTVDFKNDIIPLLTKNGCNAGACHGAAIGRGGLKLSLYGGDPQSDYTAIVRQSGGRRINLAEPDESLILLKPTESLAHDGGQVFELESESAQKLERWIREGGAFRESRSLERVEVSPALTIAKSVGQQVAFSATAHYSDGSSRDVTRWTVFAAEDASSVAVADAQGKVLRRGRHIVVARYLTEVLPIEIVVPLGDPSISANAAADANRETRNFIDDEVLKTLDTLGVPVSSQIDDLQFLRRLTIDLIGRLPSVKSVRALIASKQPLDRKSLVDELLSSPEFTEFWTLQLAKLLRMRQQQDDRRGLESYHGWLADQIARDVSYKEIAQTLITALGDSHANGEANFYRTVKGPREQAEFVSELFMGSRLRCANCHNHPLDRWTQDDYHGLAAIFAKVRSDVVVKANPSGKVIHPRTLEPARSRIPGEFFLNEDSSDARRQLADWLTDANNPYFAKAIVNRLWKHLMGRGLVEPVDDFRATNPATHPSLIDQLASDFAAGGYSLRHTLRSIALSAAYARSANAISENRDDDRFYSHAIRKPLQPEVLADAISDVLGVPSKFGGQPLGTRAVALMNPKTSSQALDILGRCGRDMSCESENGPAGSLPQKLHMFNGDLLNARIAAEGSRLTKMIDSGESPQTVIETFTIAALGRMPTNREGKMWQSEIDSLASEDERSRLLEDFVWALVTCNEFVTN